LLGWNKAGLNLAVNTLPTIGNRIPTLFMAYLLEKPLGAHTC
jgi:hypothetical protein